MKNIQNLTVLCDQQKVSHNNKSVIFLTTHCNAQMSTTTSQPKRYDGKGREILP